MPVTASATNIGSLARKRERAALIFCFQSRSCNIQAKYGKVTGVAACVAWRPIMTSTTFDTLGYFEKLKAAGVPEAQARVQADTLRVLIDDRLVT